MQSVIEKLSAFDGAINAETLAVLLSVSQKSIYKLAKQGTIPAFKVGNCLRFCPARVVAWIEKQ